MQKIQKVKVDYVEIGNGPKVVLLHATATGYKQWRYLIENYKNRFCFIAINLIGYGKTYKWESSETQKLIDQVLLLESIPSIKNCKFSIIGHSFGGSVAMMAAVHFQKEVDNLILVEPNPFYLLKQYGFLNAYEESLIIQKNIKKYYNNNWEKAVSYFADYWNGKGSWESYSNDQKVKFSEILKPNFHEWDAVLNETISIQELYKKLPKHTTFISALDTVFSIKEIKKIFNYHCKTWNFKTINSGGHMAVIKKPSELASIIMDSMK